MSRGVVAPFWIDCPAEESIDLASSAESLGYGEFWVGEMLHFDAFALAGALASSTRKITITTGPLALGLRDPTAMAMGVGSVEVIGGRPARLAIGASNPIVVTDWHGRPHGGEAESIGDAIALIRQVLSGRRTNHRGPHFQSRGFRSGLGPRSAHISVAGSGPRMLAAAQEVADRVVTNLVTRDWVARLAQQSALGVAVWTVAAVEPNDEGWEQIRRQLGLYLRAPGYRESLSEAGMGELVAKALDGASPTGLVRQITEEMISGVAAIGSATEVRLAVESLERIGAEVMLVPVTAGDEGGLRTLRALA